MGDSTAAGVMGSAAAVDDSSLVSQIARGEHRLVLTHLMQAHGADVLRFCVSMLDDAALAEDVRQAIFVEAYQSLASYGGRGNLRSWLFGIARHRCLDALKARRRWRLRFWLAPDAGQEQATRAAGPDQTLDERRKALILRACLRALPAITRVAVLLRYEDGLSYEEIGRINRERAGTVQTRVARALPIIRDCVVQKGFPL